MFFGGLFSDGFSVVDVREPTNPHVVNAGTCKHVDPDP